MSESLFLEVDEHCDAVARQVPPLRPRPETDPRLPTERALERAYDAYALAYTRLKAIDDSTSYHAALSDDERQSLFDERLPAFLAATAALDAEEKRCAAAAARRAVSRVESRASENAQRHLFVDAWPADYRYIASRFPYRPLVANRPKLEGSKHRPLHEAIDWLRVQYNTAAYIHLIVIDYDAPAGVDVREVWKLAGLPRPTYIACNLDSPRGHIAYAIKTPVPTCDAKSMKSLEYCHAVWVAYTKAVNGDMGFSGTMTKNPIHRLNAWDVDWLNPNPYTLAELHSFVELPKNARKARREARLLEDSDKVGLGRNCAIFYTVADWSYRAIRNYWESTLEQWRAAVREQCDNLNATFPEPLQLSEVKAIATSISTWTWERTTKSGFSEVQAARGAKGGSRSGVTRLAKAQVRAEEAHALKAAGLTQQEVADKLGVSLRTARNLLNLVRP